MLGVELVFEELDDGDEHVGAVVPAEDVVDAGVVALRDAAVDLPGEGTQQDDRDGGRQFLGLHREAEHVEFADVVHRDDEVEVRVLPEHVDGFEGGFRPHDGRRIAQVEFRVVLRDLGLDVSVLLEGEAVIIVTNQEDPANPPGHQLCIIRIVAHILFRPGPGPPWRWPP